MNKLILSAQQRKVLGRKVKRLRKEGVLPASIYGKNVKSQSVQVDLLKFKQVYKDAGETGLVELDTDGKKVPILIHNIQIDPVTDTPIHVDFFQVNLKEKVTAQVPVELVGESPAEKQMLGTVVQYIDEIEVEALPADLPEKFEINLENLENVDDSVLVKDLSFNSDKVEIKDDLEQIIVKVEPPKEEKVEEAPPSESPEGEAPAEAPEGEAPAEESTSAEETKE